MKTPYAFHSACMMAGILLAACTVSALSAQTEQNAVPATSAAPAAFKQYEVLATFKTIARFDGYKDIPCRHLTSLCPDRCGHASRVAVFTVASYLDYHKGGKYGDEKQQTVYVDVAKPVYGQSPQVAETIAKLKPGDIVRLDWQHLYMHDGGSMYPVRPVNSIAPAKLPEGIVLPPPPLPENPAQVPMPL
ncbi:hypothetical protein [Akkermansia glycaniphila]|nr:hypothetical protein [Akkermansia glycaniphila]